MMESGRELVIHCLFLVPYSYQTNLLEQMANDIALDLREAAVAAADIDPEDDDSMPTGNSDVSQEAGRPAISLTVPQDRPQEADIAVDTVRLVVPRKRVRPAGTISSGPRDDSIASRMMVRIRQAPYSHTERDRSPVRAHARDGAVSIEGRDVNDTPHVERTM
ncbi:unnamed protein product [Phytophthora fragariaefolia]|uniref:Unnamed protein product n=1 Tax=Phytophthora fragariaefolia TaxID=1490495 RepID=A0A9W6TUR1_9STRA|nr:unnamed protein product [Phytophthora fragariaefolia]